MFFLINDLATNHEPHDIGKRHCWTLTTVMKPIVLIGVLIQNNDDGRRTDRRSASRFGIRQGWQMSTGLRSADRLPQKARTMDEYNVEITPEAEADIDEAFVSSTTAATYRQAAVVFSGRTLLLYVYSVITTVLLPHPLIVATP